MTLTSSNAWLVLCPAIALATLGCSNESAIGTPYYDSCDGGAPDADCYAARREPNSEQVTLATEIALRYIDEHTATRQPWDWRAGVLMFALTELHRVTGDDRLRDYYRTWLTHHISEGYQVVWSDHCPPALTAIALLADEQNDGYQQVVDDVLHYVTDVAPRLPEGGISHRGTIGPDSMWLDSLFMFGMVLTRWGEQSGQQAYPTLLLEQLQIFSNLMQSESGFFVHAYGWPEEMDDDIFWARGNSWVTASMADYLRFRVVEGEADPEVQRMFDDQVRAIVQSQDSETGKWWTLANRPDEIYLETSATAIFSYAIARAYRYGLVGEAELAVALDGVAGVKDAIVLDENDRPVVTGISGPTGVGTYEDYAAVPLEDDLSYGVGGAILALIETSGLSQ